MTRIVLGTEEEPRCYTDSLREARINLTSAPPLFSLIEASFTQTALHSFDIAAASFHPF